MTQIRRILADLVRIDSVSSRSNVEIVEYLERRCEALNLITRRFAYEDEHGIEKINLIALTDDVHEVELALVGHTDTVPYDPHWSEATNLTERDGKLFGRGACDTKGFIAAALTAVEDLKISKPVALIFTADEEIGLRGAKKLAEAKPLRVRYSIVGEPTSLKPIRAGKGYSLAEVIVKGREAHSAYPALGASAVFRAARLIVRLESIAEELKHDQHDAFDPPYTTLNIGLIHGGSAKNVLAGECRFTLEWRPIPTQPSEHVLQLFLKAIEAESELDQDLYCEIDASRQDSGFETSPDSPLIKLLENASGNTSETVAFGTEAAQMMVLGSESVVIGPGDIREAHRTGEFVPIHELERCTEILRQSIMQLCSP
ncbi:MAG TPA: acetylornithine deacetylase [Pyrinomonadaceae bacterium]|jgi:acetylornithine deacetylase|nr:acetylornithine deacetylase [Pyrinomonadaceae bacterium]